MSFHLRKATPSDIPSILDAYFDAFGDHPVTRLVFRSKPEFVQKYFLAPLEASQPDPSTHFVVITDPNSIDPDKVIAFSKWVELPKAASEPATPLSWPEGADLAYIEGFVEMIEKKHKEIMRDIPHWYLDILGVRTEYRRRGAAKQLLRWGVGKADDAGVDAFVTSSPAGAPLYATFGFEVLETALLDNGNRVESFMLRPAKKAIQSQSS